MRYLKSLREPPSVIINTFWNSTGTGFENFRYVKKYLTSKFSDVKCLTYKAFEAWRAKRARRHWSTEDYIKRALQTLEKFKSLFSKPKRNLKETKETAIKTTENPNNVNKNCSQLRRLCRGPRRTETPENQELRILQT